MQPFKRFRFVHNNKELNYPAIPEPDDFRLKTTSNGGLENNPPFEDISLLLCTYPRMLCGTNVFFYY